MRRLSFGAAATALALSGCADVRLLAMFEDDPSGVPFSGALPGAPDGDSLSIKPEFAGQVIVSADTPLVGEQSLVLKGPVKPAGTGPTQVVAVATSDVVDVPNGAYNISWFGRIEGDPKTLFDLNGLTSETAFVEILFNDGNVFVNNAFQGKMPSGQDHFVEIGIEPSGQTTVTLKEAEAGQAGAVVFSVTGPFSTPYLANVKRVYINVLMVDVEETEAYVIDQLVIKE